MNAEDADSPFHSATLDYATSSADGVPHWHPAAERAIRLGLGVSQIRRFFPTPLIAAKYFAKSFHRLHKIKSGEQACIVCKKPARNAVVVGWTVRVPYRSWTLRLPAQAETVWTMSDHALCEICAAAWKSRRRVVLLLYRANKGIRVLLWCGMVVGFLVAMLSKKGAWVLIIYTSTLLPGAVLGLIIHFIERRAAPFAILGIKQGDMTFQGLLATGPVDEEMKEEAVSIENNDHGADSTPRRVLPVLTYAIPNDDSLGDGRIPEADAYIDRREGVSAITHLFGSPAEASLYFARSFSERYAPRDRIEDRLCSICNQPAAKWVNVRWVINADSRGLSRSTCETSHPVCTPCAVRCAKLGWGHRAVIVWPFLAFVPFAAAIGSAWLVQAKMIGRHYDFSESACPLLAIGLIALGLVRVLRHAALRAEVPSQIRELEQPGCRALKIWRKSVIEI